MNCRAASATPRFALISMKIASMAPRAINPAAPASISKSPVDTLDVDLHQPDAVESPEDLVQRADLDGPVVSIGCVSDLRHPCVEDGTGYEGAGSTSGTERDLVHHDGTPHVELPQQRGQKVL